MTYLLVGFYIAVLLAMVVKHTSKWSYLLLGFAAWIAFGVGQYYYLMVIAGVWLADISRKKHTENTQKWYYHVVCAIVLLVGLYLGGYPSGMIPTNHYAMWPFGQVPNMCVFYHALAAVMVFAVLLHWRPFQLVCSFKPFCLLGTICYGVFLLQTPIEFSFSLGIFQNLLNNGSGYHISACISFLISTAVLLLCSSIFHFLVEKNCDKVLKIAQERLLKKNES